MKLTMVQHKETLRQHSLQETPKGVNFLLKTMISNAKKLKNELTDNRDVPRTATTIRREIAMVSSLLSYEMR